MHLKQVIEKQRTNINELRELYPKELLTNEEFDIAVNIENILDRKNYIKQCLRSRNNYEGPKELSIYNDAWIDYDKIN